MQFKNLKELRALDSKNLAKELAAVVKYLSAISFERSQGSLKDTSQLKKARNYISWIETIKNERLKEQVETIPNK